MAATGRHRIRVARESHKFSCAHMTVFRDGSKERLHGHNFTLAIECELAAATMDHMVDFSALKAALAELCGEWKEHLLLAAGNPHLEIARDDGAELEFSLCGKRYVVPRDEVLLLPCDNVSVEALAALAADHLRRSLSPMLLAAGVRAIEVTVEETPGQGGSVWLPSNSDIGVSGAENRPENKKAFGGRPKAFFSNSTESLKRTRNLS